jgi:signal transduction histidine kinase
MTPPSELEPAILQTAVTLGLAALSWLLFRRYRKRYYAWWTVAWVLYSMRLGAIMEFLLTRDAPWLYWHQVLTGWTALALLSAALAFVMQPVPRFLGIATALFPPIWSFAAIYLFDNFLLAAIPAVVFLAGVTLWTSGIFLRHWRRVRTPGALMLAVSFAAWGLHHLDYPFLRAQGAWVPWGYYLDVLFTLAVGAGMLMLVLDDLQQGIDTLATLGVASREGDIVRETIERPLTLPAVRGSALFVRDGGPLKCAAAAADCAGWELTPPGDLELAAINAALDAGRFHQLRDVLSDPRTGKPFAFAAVLPLFPSPGAPATSALVIVGESRDPFAALDDRFLLALGHQTGTAIEREEMRRRLRSRSDDLQRLSVRMIEQHEEERRRISLELHDETAQVFSTVKMQLGLVRETADPALDEELARALELIDKGIRSIRNVTNDLRPSLLDDLGLVPAMRSLVVEFAGRGSLDVTFVAREPLPDLPGDAELALFRALQELLSNVGKHARAKHVSVVLSANPDEILLTVDDDGIGAPSASELELRERLGHVGLAGIRERITTLGGTLRISRRATGGTSAEVRVPVSTPVSVA